MLEGASAIDVVTISEREPAFPAVDACEYLSRHSLKSEIYPLELDQRTVGDLLLEAVEELESAYVVMGAYGHSRAREFLLGGATRQMLTDSPVPLLMTH
jgi:nucleotide-binding universal stress UspA family protein